MVCKDSTQSWLVKRYLNQHEIQAPLDCAYDYFHDAPNANISLRNCNY